MCKYTLLGFFWILTLSALSQNEVPDSFIISSIEVEGNTTTDSQLLKSISGLQIGQRIDSNDGDINRAIKRLWQQGLFDDVSIEVIPDKKDWYGIVISVIEVPRLKDFEFSGLKAKEANSLKNDLNLRKGIRVNRKLLGYIRNQVLNDLKDKGYYLSEVTIDREKENGFVNLNIHVQKNNRFKLSKIHFSGNTTISDRKLKRAIKSIRQKGELSFASRKYTPSSLEELEDELSQVYHSKGHIDFDFINVDSVLNTEKGEVILTIELEEGSPYIIKELVIEGNETYSDTLLNEILGVRIGDIYNQELIESRLRFNPKGQDVSGLYMDNGFLFFNVNTTLIPVGEGEVKLIVNIQEGPEAIIDKVSIAGNTITKEEVLMREITTLPGNVFRRSDVMRSQSSLAMLGFIDPEKLNVVPIPNLKKGTVDLEYQITERPNDRIELSGTWGAAIGLTGSLGFSMNNFAMSNLFKPKLWNPYPNGNGERLAVRVQSNGNNYNSYSLQYSNPWISETKPVNFFTNLVHTRISNDVSEELEDGTINSYTEKLNISGLTFGLARRLDWFDKYWSLSNSVSFNKYTFNNYDNALDVRDGETYNFTLNTTLSRNNLNHPFYPTSGSNLSLSLSVTPPYSLFTQKDYGDLNNADRYKWAEYFKFMADFKHHQSLVGKLVLKTGAHFGMVNNYTNNNPLGPFERFQMGGSGLTGFNQFLGNDIISLRGYQADALIPVTNDGLEGGTVFNKFNVELRYPVMLSSGMSAYVYGFAEAGNTWGELNTYDPFKLYKSAGFGAQFSIPMMGQVGFNWGYGFDRIPGSNKVSGSNFQFTIGVPIR